MDDQGAQLKCQVYLIQMHFSWGRNEVVPRLSHDRGLGGIQDAYLSHAPSSSSIHTCLNPARDPGMAQYDC